MPKTKEVIKESHTEVQTENYESLDQDKIDYLINKYNCEDQEYVVLKLKEKKL